MTALVAEDEVGGGRQVGGAGGRRPWLYLLFKKLIPNLPAVQIIKAQENQIPVCLRTLIGNLKCTKLEEGQSYVIKTRIPQTEVKMLTV